MNCSGCSDKDIDKKSLSCNVCKLIFCYECLNIDAKKVASLSKNQLASLKCLTCSNVSRRRNNDNTSARAKADQKVEQHSHKPAASQSSSHSGNCNPVPLTLDSISQLLDEKLSLTSPFVINMREALKKDIKELVVAEVKSTMTGLMTDFSTTTDFLASEQTDIKNKIAERDSKIEELESESIRVQRELTSLNNRLSAVEKISRDHNVEIQGVPESRSENLLGIFKSLCTAVSTPIADNDIRGFRRVAKIDPTSDRPRNIIITLSSPRLRDLLLSAVHRYNKSNAKDMLSSRHLGITVDSRRVYVVEHISPESKQIHAASRKFARDNSYKYVWVKYGQVFLRKDDNSNAVRVKSCDYLKSLV
ncbi:Zinc finger DNA binding protein [Operophtera brumata]|uniref:Zinc finger DNA binding protein n=1 Tax=Operophtera brumata TaxID=104452 RepID=A0A0L7K2U8_OPEBR|nr:Zinc finger DNA binding protein [Operophtera brumata]KOB73157.1 Zinc finger DNA binding protein [Operophtera brumata]